MATYQQIFDYVNNTASVRNRMIVAAAKFAVYTAGGGGTPSANRLAWAKAALLAIEPEVDKIKWLVGQDAQFQADGANITDANLQAVVETALQQVIPA